MSFDDHSKLSQDEIDALLNGANESGEDQEKKDEVNNDQLNIDAVLTPMEVDALGEISNISFGSAATALSTLLNQKVDITTPKVTLIQKGEMLDEFPVPHVSVYVEYTEGFRGSNVLLIKREDASVIADLMLGGDGRQPSSDINEIHLSAVQEAMNQMMGSASTSMSTMFNKRIDISPPVIELMDIKQDTGTMHLPTEPFFLKVSFRLKIGDLVDSNLMQLVPVEFSKELTGLLLNDDELTEDDIAVKAATTVEPKQPINQQVERQLTNDGNNKGQPRNPGRNWEERAVNVEPAAFSEFENAQDGHPSAQNINLLMDIPLLITVELGQTTKRIKDILEFGPGSVVELDKLAGEPVDILVNHKPIAKGEVVVIDENFGVRITEIMTQADRLRKL